MNILYVCDRDPRLTCGGDEQRTGHIWKSLKLKGSVYTIIISGVSEKGSIIMDGREEDKICRYTPKVRTISFGGKLFMPTIKKMAVINLLRYLLLKDYQFINPFNDVKFDVVVARYVYTSRIWQFWNIAPTYIDIDDYPPQEFETIHRPKIPFCLKYIGDFLVRRMTKKVLEKATGGWIPNKNQLHELERTYYFLPNIPIMPSVKYKSAGSSRTYLFTVGKMNHIPNCDGIERFLSEVWPLFHSCHPEVKYKIAGGGAPLEYRERWSKIEGIEYVGYVDDLGNAYSHCIAAVVPIYTGAGTCIKTLESLAYSRICLSTPFGARGLIDDCDESKGLFIFANPNEFIERYERIINEVDREKTEKSANEFIREKYSVEVFQNVINSSLPKYD